VDSHDLKQSDIDELLEKDIIDILGLSHLPEAEKTELRDRIVNTIQNRAFNRIVEEIKDRSKIKEFEALTEDKEIDQFFLDNQIFPDVYFFQEALAYKAELMTAKELVDAGLKPKVTHKKSPAHNTEHKANADKDDDQAKDADKA